MLVRMDIIKVSLKLTIGQFIGRLVLPVAITMFLHGIVSEVDHCIHILNIVFLATGSDVALTVPIAPDQSVVGGD